MWSQLGLPLMVLLTAPSGDLPDPLAAKTIAAELIESPEVPQQDSQLVLASTVAPLLLGRTSVQVVLWNQLTDHEPHEFPHGGLFDAQGEREADAGDAARFAEGLRGVARFMI